MSPTPTPHQTARGSLAAGAAIALVIALAAPAAAAPPTTIGPSSATAPYVLPVADGVHITSLLTVGDSRSASNGYEMVGIPDGLGISQPPHPTAPAPARRRGRSRSRGRSGPDPGYR